MALNMPIQLVADLLTLKNHFLTTPIEDRECLDLEDQSIVGIKPEQLLDSLEMQS